MLTELFDSKKPKLNGIPSHLHSKSYNFVGVFVLLLLSKLEFFPDADEVLDFLFFDVFVFFLKLEPVKHKC